MRKKTALLTVELVPSTAWMSNVRSCVAATEWERLKRLTAAKALRVCEICMGVGPKWPVECHEVWSYNDKKRIQKLERLQSLCPNCHKVKHIGFASTLGQSVYRFAIQHLADVNGWTLTEADKHVTAAVKKWTERSAHQWELDLSHLDELGSKYEVDRTRTHVEKLHDEPSET